MATFSELCQLLLLPMHWKVYGLQGLVQLFALTAAKATASASTEGLCARPPLCTAPTLATKKTTCPSDETIERTIGPVDDTANRAKLLPTPPNTQKPAHPAVISDIRLVTTGHLLGRYGDVAATRSVAAAGAVVFNRVAVSR